MTHGSVRPCPTSVARMTQIRQEDDQVALREPASGSDRAAASETTPRMPAHATTKTDARGGAGSLARTFALSRRGR